MIVTLLNHLSTFPELTKQRKMFVCKKLNLFPFIAKGWQLFAGRDGPPKNLWKLWTFCHVCEKFDSWDRFHIVAKVLIHHCQ